MNGIGNFLIKYKWYMIIGSLILLTVVVKLIPSLSKGSLDKEILDLSIKKRSQMIDEIVSLMEAREEDISDVQEKIQELQKDKDDIKVNVGKMTLREVSDVFKNLGS